jgi:hypothetical protein
VIDPRRIRELFGNLGSERATIPPLAPAALLPGWHEKGAVEMFWIGLALAFIAFLLRLNLAREVLGEFIPAITEGQLDVVCLLAFLAGSACTVVKYLAGRREIELLKSQDIAKYSATGNRSAAVIGVRIVPTPIDDWSTAFVSRTEGSLIFRCEPAAIAASRAVIEKLPSYPFSYYLLAQCLRENGDPAWKGIAKTARSIFRKTTRLPDHHPDHDLALRAVEMMLTQ